MTDPCEPFEATSGITYDKTEARAQLPAFIEWYFNESRFSAMNWADHVRRARALDLALLKFEDLKLTPLDTLEAGLRACIRTADRPCAAF